MDITFIGAGYVGLVSGIMMSHLGHNVTCIDTDQDKILALQLGMLPIYEPGLSEYLVSGLKSARLQFTSRYDQKLSSTSAIFITVGTPPLASGAADLSNIFAAIDQLRPWINQNCLIIIKSTVPPGTASQLIEYLAASNCQAQIASNPEFLREGSAVEDFLRPDRIVIGTNQLRSRHLLREIYAPLIADKIAVVSTDLQTSELIKYVSNAFLATKIAFINEMANLCEKIDADIEQVSKGVGLDSRISQKCLQAGPGFGGSCFPKDVMALSSLAQTHQVDCQIVTAVIRANQRRPADMVNKIQLILGGLNHRTLAVLGLTFKAGTDDLRSSPALEIIRLLQLQKARVIAYDPAGMTQAKQFIPGLEYASSALQACTGADALIITTEWPEFTKLDFRTIHDYLKSPIIIDLRNLLDADQLTKQGFQYHSIGRRYAL